MTTKEKPTGLELLRQPFPPHQISKLPKPTKAQTEAVRNDYKKGIRCQVCGTWHHPDVVHLDYVGHAALTDRLLDCDPNWGWEPVVLPGLPNPGNGMWISLTVCGVSRLGYGHADGKTGGDAIKETIGDALRNAAMRFGAALDLWHKGDLHIDEETPEGDNGNAAAAAPPKQGPERAPRQTERGKDANATATGPATITEAQFTELQLLFTHLDVPVGDFLKVAKIDRLDALPADWFDRAKGWINEQAKAKRETTAEVLDDEIPY